MKVKLQKGMTIWVINARKDNPVSAKGTIEDMFKPTAVLRGRVYVKVPPFGTSFWIPEEIDSEYGHVIVNKNQTYILTVNSNHPEMERVKEAQALKHFAQFFKKVQKLPGSKLRLVSIELMELDQKYNVTA